MSETQVDYTTEADEVMEMLGKGYEPSLEIEAPRKVTTRRDGKLLEEDRPAFVKIYTDFKQELKTIEGDDLKVWLYLALSVNRHTGDARPGLRKIHEDTGLAINTIRLCLERLEEKNLLDVEKEDGKGNVYHPSDYVSANKTTVSNRDTVLPTVSNSRRTVSKNRGTVSNQYRKTAQPEEPEKPDIVDGILHFEKEAQKAKARGMGWRGRESFPERLLPLADKCVSKFGTPSKRDLSGWLAELGDWYDAGATVADFEKTIELTKNWTTPPVSPMSLTRTIKTLAQEHRNKAETEETHNPFASLIRSLEER